MIWAYEKRHAKMNRYNQYPQQNCRPQSRCRITSNDKEIQLIVQVPIKNEAYASDNFTGRGSHFI